MTGIVPEPQPSLPSATSQIGAPLQQCRFLCLLEG